MDLKMCLMCDVGTKESGQHEEEVSEMSLQQWFMQQTRCTLESCSPVGRHIAEGERKWWNKQWRDSVKIINEISEK